MAYDKKLSKGQRNQIKTARRLVKQTGARDSQKFLNALNGNHYSVQTEARVDLREFAGVR